MHLSQSQSSGSAAQAGKLTSEVKKEAKVAAITDKLKASTCPASILRIRVSDSDGYLERTFMSPASVRAGILIREWVEDAALRTWVDFVGNLHGRVEGIYAGAQALLIGSYLVMPFLFQLQLIFMILRSIKNMNGIFMLIVDKSPLQIGLLLMLGCF
ncbi:hypothetical protein DITRI_Ditri19aG0093300 [Diplodiscus trichospermus]